jgi:hypothetical protein
MIGYVEAQRLWMFIQAGSRSPAACPANVYCVRGEDYRLMACCAAREVAALRLESRCKRSAFKDLACVPVDVLIRWDGGAEPRSQPLAVQLVHRPAG